MFKLFSQRVVPQLMRFPSVQIQAIRMYSLSSRKSIYIGNLPWSTERSDIEQIFLKYGSIYHINYPVDQLGRHKGIAFVEMDSEPAQQALDQLTENLSLGGRRIVLGLAKNQPGDKDLSPRVGNYSRAEIAEKPVTEERERDENKTFLDSVVNESVDEVELKQKVEEAKDETKA